MEQTPLFTRPIDEIEQDIISTLQTVTAIEDEKKAMTEGYNEKLKPLKKKLNIFLNELKERQKEAYPDGVLKLKNMSDVVKAAKIIKEG